MTETASRLLQLLALLQARRDWTGRELADRLDVSERTIRRDAQRLRELGYPVEATTGPAGGYRLHAGTAMPPLLLDDDEAVAIAVGLSGAASASVDGIEETAVRALVKLEQVLPTRLRRRVTALRSATATLAASGPRVDAEALATIAAACRDREAVRFSYRARDGAETRRRAEPHGMATFHGRWYLVAWDCEREDWRSFRVDRMGAVAVAGGRCAPRALPGGGDAASFVASSRSRMEGRHQARVVLKAPAAEIVARSPGMAPWLLDRGDGTCEYRTSDDSLEWLAARLGVLGVELEVHEPPELVEHVRELAERLARATPVAHDR